MDEFFSFDEEGNMVLPTSYLFGRPDPPVAEISVHRSPVTEPPSADWNPTPDPSGKFWGRVLRRYNWSKKKDAARMRKYGPIAGSSHRDWTPDWVKEEHRERVERLRRMKEEEEKSSVPALRRSARLRARREQQAKVERKAVPGAEPARKGGKAIRRSKRIRREPDRFVPG